MKINSYKRIRREDYPPEFQEIIDTLSLTLNDALEQIFNTLQNGVDLTNNINCKVKEFDITVDNIGVPTTETVIKKELISKLQGMTVIQATNSTSSSTYPSSGIFISYTEQQNGILLNHITGLQANNTYHIKVVLWT